MPPSRNAVRSLRSVFSAPGEGPRVSKQRQGEGIQDSVAATTASAAATATAMDIAGMGGSHVLAGALDVGRIRESTRRRRLWHLLAVMTPVMAYLYYRIGTGNIIRVGMPSLSQTQLQILLPLGLIVILCIVLVVPMMAMGKSPH